MESAKGCLGCLAVIVILALALVWFYPISDSQARSNHEYLEQRKIRGAAEEELRHEKAERERAADDFVQRARIEQEKERIRSGN